MNEHRELTQEEVIFYTNHALIDRCDDCGEWMPITNRWDGKNYLTFVNGKLYCQSCLK
jgi:hypothetical protein